MNSAPSDSLPLSTPALIGIAIILAFIWGTAYTFVGLGVRSVTPIWLVSTRCCLGAFLVTVWAIYRGHKFPPLSDIRWRWYFMLGLVGMVLPFWLLSMGQVKIDSGLTAIIAGTMPLITIVLSHFFAGEPLTVRKMAGFSLGFVGTIILFLPEDLSLSLIVDWRPQLLIVGGAFCYAVTTILAKRAPKTPPSLGAAMMLIGAAILATIAAVISGVPSALPPVSGLIAIVGLGVGSTALGNIMFLFVVQKTGPSTLAKINYFPPMVSVIAGIWFLSEPFNWRIVIAFVVIAAGLILARTDTRKKPA